MTEYMINIGNLHVSVLEKRTNAPWIVCLHGIQSNKKIFSALLEKPFFKDYSLLSIDFIGFGKSSKPTDFSYDIEDQAMMVEKLLKELGIEECHIIGHSMGGMVGTLLLEKLGKNVLSFVNMEGNLTGKDSGASLRVLEQSFDTFCAGGYETFKKKETDTMEPGTTERIKSLSMIPDYAFYKAAESIVTWAKSDKLMEIFTSAPQKKLYVYGNRNSDKAARVPDSIQKAEIANAGHRMLTDNLEGTYETIERFFKA